MVFQPKNLYQTTSSDKFNNQSINNFQMENSMELEIEPKSESYQIESAHAINISIFESPTATEKIEKVNKS